MLGEPTAMARRALSTSKEHQGQKFERALESKPSHPSSSSPEIDPSLKDYLDTKFNKADSDGAGTLNKEEFFKLMDSLSLSLPMDQIEALWQKADTDNNDPAPPPEQHSGSYPMDSSSYPEPTTETPTLAPTGTPTKAPTKPPTAAPTISPTEAPTGPSCICEVCCNWWL